MRITFLSLVLVIALYGRSQTCVLSPLHQRVVTSGNNTIYDSKAWSFQSGTAIRATPLVKGNTIYIGNAAGDFLAIDKRTGKELWRFSAGAPVHSSAIAIAGRIYFSDNRQTVYALTETTGKLAWKFNMDKKKEYPWRFDYYYASPIFFDAKLFIGGDDGYMHALDPLSGKQLWKFKAKGIIRSSAAIYKNLLLFGDTEATLYAVDHKTGKEQWQFRIDGDTMRNENFGFDRRALNASPVVAGNKVIIGARDGFLYCVNADNGRQNWKVDHRVSWVISTVAVKDTFVVTGTSDGRFVQAVHLETGREIWKYHTAAAVWASPLIVNDKVYAAGFDGQLYCIDLHKGKRVSQYKTDAMMLSSPVWSDDKIYVGSDDGQLYAFGAHSDYRQYGDDVKRYVFYEPGVNIYFRSGSDLKIKNYLAANGFKTVNTDSLMNLLPAMDAKRSVIVFATDYFPKQTIDNGRQCLLRKFLDGGGRIVLPGILPTVYKIDENKQPVAFAYNLSDTLFDIRYGAGDTRSFMGQYPSFPTAKGKALGLPDQWVNSLFIDEKNVDIILGKNENGSASSFIKKYTNGGQLIQLWMDPDKPERLDVLIKAAEWDMDHPDLAASKGMR